MIDCTTEPRICLLPSLGPPIFGITLDIFLVVFVSFSPMCSAILIFLSSWVPIYVRISWLLISVSSICIVALFIFLPASWNRFCFLWIEFKFFEFNPFTYQAKVILVLATNVLGSSDITTIPRSFACPMSLTSPKPCILNTLSY